jgi:hypothetical protein
MAVVERPTVFVAQAATPPSSFLRDSRDCPQGNRMTRVG